MVGQGPGRGLFPATVVGNELVCREHFRLLLAVEGFPSPLPGQFVQLGCQPPADRADEPDEHPWRGRSEPGLRTRSLLAPTPLLRRPFSLAGVRPRPAGLSATELEVIGRVVGLGTTRLSRLAVGERIDLLGPLGNSFPMPAGGQTAVLVGGGVGIPPMMFLAERLAGEGCPAVAVVGVGSADLLPLTLIEGVQPDRAGQATLCVEEFARHGIAAVVSSDDGTIGLKGLATDGLADVLDRLDLPPEKLVIYTCGPERMMRTVAEMASARSVRAWVAMERSMACGIGTCQSCVCRVRRAGEADWQYRLVCTDGPVFDGREIVWE